MTIAGIIAEYNPFHNGHLYQIEQTKRAGATHIVAVMSGSFVQRGEPALFSKWERAAAALKSGVDLVLELPVSYAMSSAERFGFGGVFLLHALGCVDMLSFGSESGNLNDLQQAAALCRNLHQSPDFTALLKSGCSYPTARMRAVARLGGEQTASLLASPNNTLGISYLNALAGLKSDIRPFTVSRIGTAHDAEETSGNYASASLLRQKLGAGESIAAFMPQSAVTCLTGKPTADPNKLETALLWQLRRMTAEDYAALPDVTEGLQHRLYRAAQSAESLSDFLDRVKTKRYTHARLRRIAWSAALGLRRTDYRLPIPYLRVLGFNPRGREILALAGQAAALPIVSSFREMEKISPRFAALEKGATDLWNLAVSPPLPCGADYTRKIVLTKS